MNVHMIAYIFPVIKERMKRLEEGGKGRGMTERLRQGEGSQREGGREGGGEKEAWSGAFLAQ